MFVKLSEIDLSSPLFVDDINEFLYWKFDKAVLFK